MSWWLWVVFGFVLATIELATPGGFFVIFFGISAICVGLLVAAGLFSVEWQQWLLFTVLALVALRLFRRPLLARLTAKEPAEIDSLIGQVAIAETSMDAGQYGRAELRGASWQARNVADRAILSGQRTRVAAVDGLRLDVRPE